MPTYVYECISCGEFEWRQSIFDSALERCPQCGCDVRQVITGGTGFIIKERSTPAGSCTKDTSCCGRETRCDKPPCEK